MQRKIFDARRSGPHTYRTMPSKRFLNHLTVSAWLILCEWPILFLQRRRLAMRSPGRVLSTAVSMRLQ